MAHFYYQAFKRDTTVPAGFSVLTDYKQSIIFERLVLISDDGKLTRKLSRALNCVVCVSKFPLVWRDGLCYEDTKSPYMQYVS